QKKTGKKGVTEQPLQCGPESKIKLTVVKRDDRKVRDALVAFNASIREYDRRGGKVNGDEAAARHFYGLAKLAEADKDFEAYLDVRFPVGLDFDPAPEKKAIVARSRKRFDDWFLQKQKAAGAVRGKYGAVLTVKDNADSIAAAARIGQL